MRRSFALTTLAATCLLPQIAAAQALVPIQIATTPNDSGAEPFYATEMGFFRNFGLDVQTVTLANGGMISAGVSAGTFQIAQAGIPPLATARANGLPFLLIAPASIATVKILTTALVVAKNGPIHSARDLSGKTVAVSGLHNIPHIGAQAWIDRNGGDAKSVRYVEMPDAITGAAVADGRIDAAVISQPSLSAALAGNGRVLGAVYSGIADDFFISGWFATESFVKTRPDVVSKFASAMAETARWANANHEKSGPILEKYTKQQLAPGALRVLYGEKLTTAQLQPILDATVKYNALKASISASEIVAPGMLVPG